MNGNSVPDSPTCNETTVACRSIPRGGVFILAPNVDMRNVTRIAFPSSFSCQIGQIPVYNIWEATLYRDLATVWHIRHASQLHIYTPSHPIDPIFQTRRYIRAYRVIHVLTARHLTNCMLPYRNLATFSKYLSKTHSSSVA